MRKAAAGLSRKATSRRRQAQEQQYAKDEQAAATNTSPTNADQTKKQGTTDEQALTAKNYRLAKELSELRVRHREETKNVTRLTMENMNLASRCREAISHVAMLKKELAMHQRRTAEAMNLQRQAMQRKLPELDALTTTTDVAVEMEKMDRIIAAHAPPTPPLMPKVTAKVKTTTSTPSNNGTEDTFDFESTSVKTPFHDVEDEINGDEVILPNLSRTIFPHSPSPKIVEDMYNESFPADLPPTRKIGTFHQSPTLMETETDDRSYSSAISEDPSTFSTTSETHRSLNNVAFDASFDTTFPTSFSSRKEDLVAVNMVQPAIYNPFVPSPPKLPKVGEESVINRVGVRDRSPMRRKVDSQSTGPKPPTPAPYTRATLATVPASPKLPEDQEAARLKGSVRSSSPANLPTLPRSVSSRIDLPRSTHRASSPLLLGSRLFPRSSPTPESQEKKKENDTSPEKQSGSTENFASPTKSSPRAAGVVSPDAKADPEQPCRPEKVTSATARARYEKALQPRVFSTTSTTRSVGRLAATNRFLNSDSEEDDPPEQPVIEQEEGPTSPPKVSPPKSGGVRSPSLVLKRLQQRRIKERMANDERAANNGGDAGSVSSATSGRSANSGQLSTISGISNASSRVESRRRIVALRLAKANNDTSSSTPFDEGEASFRSERSASSMSSVNSLRASEVGDELMGRGDTLTYSTGSFRGNRSYYENTGAVSPQLPARSTRGTDESSNLSPDSMIKESHALDAMAAITSQPTIISPPPNADAATSRFATAGKLRRAVKQPISYAEPTLNSKLRRGDVYFDKGQDSPVVNDSLQDLSSSQVRT